MKYREKPLTVEAIRFLSAFSIDEMIEAWGESFIYDYNSFANALVIDVGGGTMVAEPGDYIVKKGHCDFFSIKTDLFEETYEQVY